MTLQFSSNEYMGKEKKVETKQLTAALSNKWYIAYSETCEYVWDHLPESGVVFQIDGSGTT